MCIFNEYWISLLLILVLGVFGFGFSFLFTVLATIQVMNTFFSSFYTLENESYAFTSHYNSAPVL